ncbi:MAG: hypothetical protein VKK42_03205 [Lyngbya sp.]|nr:hypothetical protein [Lyngbya sp.]
MFILLGFQLEVQQLRETMTDNTSTYLLFDGTMTVTGTPEDITYALWKTSKGHKNLENIQEYMKWQDRTCQEISGYSVDTSSYEQFISSLASNGFLTPVEIDY